MLLHVGELVETHLVECLGVAVVGLDHLVVAREDLKALGHLLPRGIGLAELREVLNEGLLCL
jgi:hypothetical protein